ncbi:MAG: GTP-binding protein [Candidatus Lokiarchaeota archaeon]|nr:GTP-binding protein [Candidatus Lokiarchaeota archaeon]
MPKFYKLKLVLGGSINSGKNIVISSDGENGSPIGVTFKSVDCFVNKEDSYKFIIWDLKDHKRFRFFFPVFSRGACAGLLCFDLSNRKSFSGLNRWITLFKENEKEIPIILIGTKTILANREVTEEELNNLIKKEGLIYIEHTSLLSQEENLKEIFKKLIKTLHSEQPISHFRLTFNKEDEQLIKLKKFFDRCPICKRRIHNNVGLKNMYRNMLDLDAMRLKESLIRLVNDFEEIRDDYSAKISLGIPCCDCYKKIFG